MPFGSKFDYKNQPNQDVIERCFDSWLACFTQHTGEIRGELFVDKAIAKELVNRYFEDLSRYSMYSSIKNQDIFKRMGHWAFWVRKLHPLKLIPEKGHKLSESLAPFINERFALLMATISCGMDQCVNVVLTDKFIQDFLFHFRYKSVSPHSLSMLFHALYSKSIVRTSMS